MPIRTEVNSTTQLTIHIAKGEVSFDELMDTLKSYYIYTSTLNNIWDFTEGTLNKLSSYQIERLASLAAEVSKSRIDEKSALIAPRNVDYGLLRMSMAYFETKDRKAEIRLFRRFGDAVAWISEESDMAQ